MYGPLNLLVESGYNITQAEADVYVKQKMIQEDPFNPDVIMNTPKFTGFPMGVTESVVAKYTPNYQTGDFMKFMPGDSFWGPPVKYGPDAGAAERFLIDKTKAGQPV